MATLTEPCPCCGEPAQVSIGQRIGFDATLQWSESWVCTRCGGRLEADSLGIPYPRYRDAILASEGTWCLDIDQESARIRFAKLLRTHLKLGLSDAMHAARLVPGRVWKGTACEVDWMFRLLQGEGLSCEKHRIECSDERDAIDVTAIRDEG